MSDSQRRILELLAKGTLRVLHDHPLYAIGHLDPRKIEVLQMLAEFADKPKFQRLAEEYGWNQSIAASYVPTVPIPSGDTLVQAQRLWKEKKDADPISAIFLGDVSGSMRGSRLAGVKEALIEGSKFISPTHKIGVMFFSDTVSQVLDLKQFDIVHHSSLKAAVEDVQAGGGTAMYDGIAVALWRLVEEKKANPQVKPMLFVLTDGRTQNGLSFAETKRVIRGVRIPIYTIGYEADVKELKRLSGLVEAVSINANEGQIAYKIAELLNAQM